MRILLGLVGVDSMRLSPTFRRSFKEQICQLCEFFCDAWPSATVRLMSTRSALFSIGGCGSEENYQE